MGHEICVAKVQTVPVESCEANSWNPNSMREADFARLCEEIEKVGFIEPIQVVPLEGGKYRIIGGFHRHKAAVHFGLKEVPAVLLSDERWRDEDLQKFVTVRLNVLRGKMDPEKFSKLYDEMAAKYGAEALQNLMGYVDEDAWNKLVGSVKKGLKDSGVPETMVEKFEDVANSAKSVDDLESILQKLFSEYGDTMVQNFMVFSHGGKEHLYVVADDKTFELAKKIADEAKSRRIDVNQVFQAVFSGWEDKIGDLPDSKDDWS